MREATKEERESINNHIKSISQKVLAIPDGATNGDVILSTLKEYNMRRVNSWVVLDISIPEGEYFSSESTLSFPASFWDAPYERSND